jgi:polyhydroxyalkanoate synthase subunit PhaC
MVGEDSDKTQAQVSGNMPGPDVMLGLWASWMDQMSAPAMALADPGTTWWQMTTDNPASNLITGGLDQLQSSLSQDPTLRSLDQMWNANPLREVVPVDWAEIARALRIVWLRSLRKPSAALAVTDLNQDLWRSAVEVWQEAGQRWLNITGASPANGPSSATTDKRFAAPEWHANPVYRTLQQIYLLASDWLLQQGNVGTVKLA